MEKCHPDPQVIAIGLPLENKQAIAGSQGEALIHSLGAARAEFRGGFSSVSSVAVGLGSA